MFAVLSLVAEEPMKQEVTWVQDGAGTASAGPGQRIQAGGPVVQRCLA